MWCRLFAAVTLALVSASHAHAQLKMWETYHNEAYSSELPGRILNELRPTQGDLLILTNRDRIYGTVLTKQFHLRAPYGNLTVDADKVAAMSWNVEPAGRAAIASVLGDRFTGYIEEDALDFVTTGGTKMRIERRFVYKVIFAVRPNETAKIVPTDVFVAGNCDAFSGRLVDPQFVIATPYLDGLPLNLVDLKTVAISGRYSTHTEVTLIDGGLLQGRIEPTKFDIELDIGGRITFDASVLGHTKIHRLPPPPKR